MGYFYLISKALLNERKFKVKHILKKGIAILLAILCAFNLAVVSFAEETVTSGTCGENVTWNFDKASGMLRISGEGAMESFPIYKRPWQDYIDYIKTVIIDEGVTSISKYAFYLCQNLTDVTIPESLTVIDDGAFHSCNSIESVVIPDNVTSIGESAFKDCCGIESVVIPDSVTKIGGDAFRGCGNLKSIIIPGSVTTIGNGAFSDCDNLANVSIPDSVVDIGDGTFVYSNVIDFYVDKNNQYYSTDEYGVLFNKDKTTLIKYTSGREDASYFVPDDVNTIEPGAFSRSNNISSITISDNVTTLGDSVFSFCEKLTDITIGKGIKTISERSFYGCGALERMIIPDNVEVIKEYAFRSCENLVEIEIPDSVKNIGTGAFDSCKSLGNIKIPDNVTTISKSMFSGCTSLKTIVIPDSVTTIESFAFEGCSSLETINIPNRIKIINNNLFAGCTGLKSVTLPYGVTDIKPNAFDGCVSLERIVIPASVTSISPFAFDSCESLASITIPDSVIYIGQYAFFKCDGLAVTIYTGTAEQWENIDIDNYNEDLTKNVVFDCKDSIGVCGENAGWVYDDETFTLTISGTGEIEDKYSGWDSFYKDVKTLNICEGITHIGTEVFDRFISLDNVMLPESLESVGFNTFRYCLSLQNIRIPQNVKSIANAAFRDCTALESVVILGDSCSIGASAFQNCTALSDVYISDDVISVGYNAFTGTAFYDDSSNWENDVLYAGNNLIEAKNTLSGEYVIKDGTKSITERAFYGCSELESVIIPQGVSAIQPYTFQNCTGLAKVSFPASLKKVSQSAFENCSKLTSVTFADGLESVENNAFANCTALETIVVPDSLKNLEENAFSNTAFVGEKDNWENGVLYIGKFLYSTNKQMKGEYKVKDGTEFICDAVFQGSHYLTAVIFPTGLKSIGERMFVNCPELQKIVLPSSLESIEWKFIEYCENLTEICYSGTQEQWNKIEIGPENDVWLTKIVFDYVLTGNCGENAVWSFSEVSKNLTISGTGAVSDYSGWSDIAGAVTYVEIGNGITSVGENVFNGFASLEEVYMAESVSELGDNAFAGCSELAIVTALSDTLSFSNAFSGNDSRLFFVAKAGSEACNAFKSAGYTVNGISTNREKDGHKVLAFDGKTTVYKNLDYNYISNLISDNMDAHYLYFDKVTFEGIAPDTIIIDEENIDSAEEYFTLNEVYISVSVNGKTVSLPELVELLLSEDADGIISFEQKDEPTIFEQIFDFFESVFDDYITEANTVIISVINAIKRLFRR